MQRGDFIQSAKRVLQRMAADCTGIQILFLTPLVLLLFLDPMKNESLPLLKNKHLKSMAHGNDRLEG